MMYCLSKSTDCDVLGCTYFKVIYRLQSFFSNGMMYSCKISTDKRFLCNSRASCNNDDGYDDDDDDDDCMLRTRLLVGSRRSGDVRSVLT